MLEEAWAIAAEQNSPLVRRCTLASLASHRLLEGQYEKVLVLTQEAIAVAEENTWAWSWATFQRGIAFFAIGEFDNALPLLKRALSRVRHTLRQWLAVSLAYCGLVIARQGEHKRAVELFALGLSKPNYRRGLEIDPLLTRTRAELEGALGEERFAAAWERGKALDAMAVAEDVLAVLEAAG